MRTKIDLVEGTPEWYAHRNRFFNASESGAVMSCSPFEPRNPAELFDRKMGLTTFSGNFATRRGHELEPLAKRAFEASDGKLYPAQAFVNGRYASSLDGWNDETKTILEIKCPMSLSSPLFKIKNWQDIKQLAPQYWWQMVHQFHCSGATGTYLVVYMDDKNWSSHYIEANELALDLPNLLEAWEEFGRHFDANSRPDDGIAYADDGGFIALAQAYKELMESKKAIETDLKLIEKDLKDLADSYGAGKVIGGGLQIIKAERVGSIDYSKVPQLEGINLEDYRKPATTYWTIREAKE